MNEDFVSFELAVKLKEKGFREKCIAFYTSTKTFYYNNTNVCADVTDLLDCCNAIEEFDDIDAPTISQVLRWLRKTHQLHVEFVATIFGYSFIISRTPEAGGTRCYFSRNNYDGPDDDSGVWNETEDAAIFGIEYILDNLI